MSHSVRARPRAEADKDEIADYLFNATSDLGLVSRWELAVEQAIASAAEYPTQTPIIDFIPVT